MKRWFPVLLVLMLLLSGCSEESLQMDKALALRDNLQKGDGCSFTAVITADYGETIHTFTLACESDSLGNVRFHVTAPDSISGIAGTISKDGGTITFDDQALAFSLLADGQLSPVSAPWVFLHTLLGGYICSCGEDGEYVKFSLDDTYLGQTLQTEIWLDAADLPIRCEMMYDGKRILSLDVREFTFL